MEEVKTCETCEQAASAQPSPTSPSAPLFVAIPEAARILGFATEAFYQATSRHKDPLPHVVVTGTKRMIDMELAPDWFREKFGRGYQ